jgi:hypothetical protein
MEENALKKITEKHNLVAQWDHWLSGNNLGATIIDW